MEQLKTMHCEACHPDAHRVTESELFELMAQLPHWQVRERDGIKQLERDYTFKNFKLAWAFCDRVAELAESEAHHPAILLEWGKVRVTWWTHAIGGLHQNDAVMAAKTDELLAS